MISGKLKKRKIEAKDILDRISEYDVFRYYVSDKTWKINKVMLSPLRQETHESFIISYRNEKLRFIDFSDTSLRGNCFDFVKLLYNMPSFYDALKLVDRDFNLGLSSREITDYKKITFDYEQPEKIEKKYSLIQVTTRNFNNEELAYWNLYHQDLQDLKRENVYAISKVYLNKELFPYNETDLRFGYLYGDSWKIYRPFADRRSKWVPNNVSITEMDGLDNVKNCDVAFINKSKKDYMVMKKLLPNSCAVQNEGMACFSKENVEYLKSNSNRQILSFDSDVTGVKNSQQITKLFEFEYCNVPKKYLIEGIKDWAELAKEYGMNALQAVLKKRKLI